MTDRKELAERIDETIRNFPTDVSWSQTFRRSEWAAIVAALRSDIGDECARLRSALFPEPAPHPEGHGFILNDADENLSAALYDLRRLKADPVCIGTIEKVLGQLTEARLILEAARRSHTGGE